VALASALPVLVSVPCDLMLALRAVPLAPRVLMVALLVLTWPLILVLLLEATSALRHPLVSAP
jgi:hypothetical protein